MPAVEGEVIWLKQLISSCQFPIVFCHNDPLIANFVYDEVTGDCGGDRWEGDEGVGWGGVGCAVSWLETTGISREVSCHHGEEKKYLEWSKENRGRRKEGEVQREMCCREWHRERDCHHHDVTWQCCEKECVYNCYASVYPCLPPL